jgi:hypothetical protein
MRRKRSRIARTVHRLEWFYTADNKHRSKTTSIKPGDRLVTILGTAVIKFKNIGSFSTANLKYTTTRKKRVTRSVLPC